VGVFDPARDGLVGYGEVARGGRADAAVDPGYEGRGVGTAIAHWVRQRAAELGDPVVGMPVPEGSSGDRLLAALGWQVRWTSWILHLPEGRQIEPQPLPAGYAIRDAVSAEDQQAAHTVLEDAFLEWSQRDRQSFDDFAAGVMRRPGFAPWQLRVLTDKDDVVVGACFAIITDNADAPAGFVDRVAVRRDRRGLGLARALLADAFRNARDHGATVCELSTDSRTGALSLYQHVGMVVSSTWVNRAIETGAA
jgi:GNAT superfamily N-acetyltransferase